jgi:SsrA-binding protein
MMREEKKTKKIDIVNRKARHDYHVLDRLEAGIVLKGTEIKSIRKASANLRDTYARIDKGEVFLYNMHIAPYEFGNRYNHDPIRERKLLFHKSEIKKLINATSEKGLSLIPLRLYINGKGKAKVELAIAKGKKFYDKRETIKKRDAEREMRRAVKSN